jgi:hypothetical protein
MKRKQFGHLICSKHSEENYMLLYRSANEFLRAHNKPPVSKTKFTDRLISSISVEMLASKVLPKLMKGRQVDPLIRLKRRFKIYKGKDGQRYFKRVKPHE